MSGNAHVGFGMLDLLMLEDWRLVIRYSLGVMERSSDEVPGDFSVPKSHCAIPILPSIRIPFVLVKKKPEKPVKYHGKSPLFAL